MLQRQLDVGLQEAFLAAAVVALAVVAVGVARFSCAQQPGDAVGELDLAARAARLVARSRRRRAASARSGRRRPGATARPRAPASRRCGSTSTSRSPTGVAGDDAVAPRLLGRHFLHGDDRRCAVSANCSTICVSTGGVADHQVVGQQHGERLVADHRLRAQHGVAEAQRLRPGGCRCSPCRRACTARTSVEQLVLARAVSSSVSSS